MKPIRDTRVYWSENVPRGTLPAESVIQEIKDVLDQPIINLRLIHRQVLSVCCGEAPRRYNSGFGSGEAVSQLAPLCRHD